MDNRDNEIQKEYTKTFLEIYQKTFIKLLKVKYPSIKPISITRNKKGAIIFNLEEGSEKPTQGQVEDIRELIGIWTLWELGSD